jgi:pyridoxal/pyridoxine/pyridoxamine kinase
VAPHGAFLFPRRPSCIHHTILNRICKRAKANGLVCSAQQLVSHNSVKGVGDLLSTQFIKNIAHSPTFEKDKIIS